MYRGKNAFASRNSPLSRLLPLAVFFLCGAAAGQVLAFRAPDTIGGELRQYLSGYHSLKSTLTLSTLPQTALAYLRYPVLAAFLSAVSGGAVLLYGTAAAFGFFLSFSVGCFAAAYGREGVILAAALLGIRCIVTLPCFFLLAVPVTRTAIPPGTPDRREWRWRLKWCGVALLAGMGAELLFTPRLLRLALEWVLD